MRILYRPERELIPRKGKRYIGELCFEPGMNDFEESRFETIKDLDEVKEYLKLTVLEYAADDTVRLIIPGTVDSVVESDDTRADIDSDTVAPTRKSRKVANDK